MLARGEQAGSNIDDSASSSALPQVFFIEASANAAAAHQVCVVCVFVVVVIGAWTLSCGSGQSIRESGQGTSHNPSTKYTTQHKPGLHGAHPPPLRGQQRGRPGGCVTESETIRDNL